MNRSNYLVIGVAVMAIGGCGGSESAPQAANEQPKPAIVPPETSTPPKVQDNVVDSDTGKVSVDKPIVVANVDVDDSDVGRDNSISTSTDVDGVDDIDDSDTGRN